MLYPFWLLLSGVADFRSSCGHKSQLAEGKHREGRSRKLALVMNSRSLGEGKVPRRRREAGTFQAAQKRSRKSCNGNRTGTEIVRRFYRVTRRTEAREPALGGVNPCHVPHTTLQEAPGTSTRLVPGGAAQLLAPK